MRFWHRFQRRLRGETGAAAVEFSLLFPIFVLLTFGMITAGIALWRNVAITQAARDSARLGATYPIDNTGSPTPGSADIDTWLQELIDNATVSSGWGITGSNASSSDVDGDVNDYGYICAAYVKPAAGPATVATKSRWIGTPRTSDGDKADTTKPCFDDGLSGARSQVVVRRVGRFNAIFLARDWEMVSRSSMPYERSAP